MTATVVKGGRPTLLIVMGTSGSGKSTVGAALGEALSCPFVDGDDLHPASNVAKMSAGQPLNDADREPWLLKIRRTGLELALTQHQPNLPKDGEKKQLAEVLETSHQETTPVDITAAKASTTTTSSNTTATTEGNAKQEGERGGGLAVIACSSLKLVYRRLLRGTISSLSDPAATQPETDAVEPADLRVVHVFLDLSRQLLEERMANRKGHFMKLDMLYSQLDTLQPPTPTELGTVIVKVQRETSTQAIVAEAVRQLKAQHVI